MSDPDETVALATSDDLDRLVELWLALVEHGRSRGLRIESAANELPARELLAAAVGDDRVLVARVEDAVVGFCVLVHDAGGLRRDATRGVVENLYVEPDHRGRGIGSALLAAGERRLVEAGVDVVSVEVMAADDDVRRFYEDRGYRAHRVVYEKPAGGAGANGRRDE